MARLTPKELDVRFERIKTNRANFEEHWQDCADQVLPRKRDITFRSFPGEKKMQRVFDSTPIQANELLASALCGLMTNPATQWFELTTGDTELDKQDDIKVFLQDTERKILAVLNSSNFTTEIHELYLDLGCFGTSAISIEEDDKDIVRFQTRAMKEIFIDETNLGRVDEVYRKFDWPAKKVVLEFGMENVPPEIAKKFKTNDNDLFPILHAVYPEEHIDGSQPLKRPKRFISQFKMIGKDSFLREGIFREFPFATPRWTKVSGEVYGRSPSMKALPDIMMLNEMMKTTIKGAQKTVDPPLMAPDDGFIFPLKTHPGGLNYFRAGSQDRIQPFANDARIDFGMQMIESVRQRIREAFFIDQLQLVQGPQMTATEVLQRTEERMRILGPVLARMNSELLRPLIDRVFAIMLRRGKIREEDIPEELSERQIDVRYSSLIAKAQRTSEAQNIIRALEASQFFIQAQPQSVDMFDADEAIKFNWEIFGAPHELIRGEREVAQLREARVQAQQEAEEQQRAQQEAQNLGQVAKVVQNQ